VYDACLIAALTQGANCFCALWIARRHAAGGLAGREARERFPVAHACLEHASRNQFRVESCRQLGIHAVTARSRPAAPAVPRNRPARGPGYHAARRPGEAWRKCILIGFSDRVARRLDFGTPRCELVHGRRGTLARESVVQRSALLVAAEVHEVEGKDKALARC